MCFSRVFGVEYYLSKNLVEFCRDNANIYIYIDVSYLQLEIFFIPTPTSDNLFTNSESDSSHIFRLPWAATPNSCLEVNVMTSRCDHLYNKQNLKKSHL